MSDLDKEFDKEIDLSSEFDNEVDLESEFDSEEDLSEKSDEMSKLQSLGVGISEGATLGLDRILGGVSSAALEGMDRIGFPVSEAAAFLSGDSESLENTRLARQKMEELGIKEEGLPSLLDEYKSGKEKIKAQAEKSSKDNPYTTLAGNVAGGFVSGGALTKTLGGAAKLAKSKRLLERAKQARDLGNTSKARGLIYEATKQNVKQLAKEGATAGAITGGAMSDGEDVTEVAKDVILGAGTGGILGGALESIGGAVKAVGVLAPGLKDMTKSYFRGSVSGKDLSKKEFRDQLEEAALKFAKDFDDRLSKLKLSKDRVQELAEKMGVTINSADDLDAAYASINNLEFEADRKDAEKLLNVVSDAMGKPKAMRKAEERMAASIAKDEMRDTLAEGSAKLDSRSMKRTLRKNQRPEEVKETNIFSDDMDLDTDSREALIREEVYRGKDEFGNEIKRKVRDIEDVTPSNIEILEDETKLGRVFKRYKDLATGKVKSFPSITEQEKALLKNPEKLTIDQAEQLLDSLNSKFSVLGNDVNLPKEAKTAATELAKSLRKKINLAYDTASDKVDGKSLGEINKSFTKLLEAKKWAGIDDSIITEYDKRKHIQKMAKFIEGSSDKEAISNLDMFLKVLKENDDSMFKQYQKEIEEFRDLARIVGDEEALQSGSQYGAIFGALSSAANRLANMVGRGVHTVRREVGKTKKNFIASGAKDFIDSSPETVQLMLKRSMDTGGHFTNQLKQALAAKSAKRRAILFGLYSNPSFRKTFGLDKEPVE